MNIFRREFLGRVPASGACKILNEQDIKLIYIPSKSLILGSSEVAVRIKNGYLGYMVDYTIVDFQIQMKVNLNGFEMVESVFYTGTSSF